jgi:peptidoglycan/LPS O-acetylase OafA/YrhL
LLNRLPSWLQAIVSILVFNAVASLVMAPLLDVLPAYFLFGVIFLAGLAFLWWNTGRDKRSIRIAVLMALLSATGTFVLYGVTLQTRDADNYFTWILAGVACLGAFFLIAWLLPPADEDKATTPSE